MATALKDYFGVNLAIRLADEIIHVFLYALPISLWLIGMSATLPSALCFL